MKQAPHGKPEAATLAQMKALGNPLRYRIFESLVGEPRTASQMAQHLGMQPTSLYHHFHVLEKAGLIRAAGTRKKRGTVEQYFEAAADRIEAKGMPAAQQAALMPALVEGVLGSTLRDLKRSGSPGEGGRPQQYLKRYRIRVPAGQASKILARLEAVAKLCEKTPGGGGGKEFCVTLAFYESPVSK